MSKNPSKFPSDPVRTIKKLFLSAFVVFAFMCYVLVDRLTRPDSALNTSAAPTAFAAAPATLAPFATAPGALPSTSSSEPTVAPAPAQITSTYKNGSDKGEVVDAYYGLVQVQVDIQGG